MVKKLKAMAEKKSAAGAGLFDSALANSVRESAKEIWLAGMGAFAKAQAEGKQVFEALVKEGNSLQKKTQGAAEEKFSEVTSKMTSMADEVTAKALKKLGVPTSNDVQALAARVDALSAQLAGRTKATAKTASARTATKKRAPAKTAAKRASRKSAA